MKHSLAFLTLIIIISGLVASGVGFFDSSGSGPYKFVNQYGDVVEMYGKGLYARDSFFRAPISRGTDFTMLFVGCPLLTIALILDIRRKSLKTRIFLVSVISFFTYYAANIAFGVTYNYLHLVYIVLFSAAVFALIAGMMSIDYYKLENSTRNTLPYRGVYTFLTLTGIALFVAWLPDIISSLINKRPLALIETYTTEVTYVLDMGIIAPVAFICLHLLKQRKGMGYVLLEMLLTLCIIIGIMLPIQTLFQIEAGIDLPLAAIITKMGSFCLLALFAIYFKIQSGRNIASGKQYNFSKNQMKKRSVIQT